MAQYPPLSEFDALAAEVRREISSLKDRVTLVEEQVAAIKAFPDRVQEFEQELKKLSAALFPTGSQVGPAGPINRILMLRWKLTFEQPESGVEHVEFRVNRFEEGRKEAENFAAVEAQRLEMKVKSVILEESRV